MGAVLGGLALIAPAIIGLIRGIQNAVNQKRAEGQAAMARGDLKAAGEAFQAAQDHVVHGISEIRDRSADQVASIKSEQKELMIAIGGRVNSGKTTTANAVFTPTPLLTASARENTVGFKKAPGATLNGQNVTLIDMQGVSDELFQEHLQELTKLFELDCLVFNYTDSLKNVSFLVRTCVAARVPVIAFRNKSDKDDPEEVEVALEDDRQFAEGLGVRHVIAGSAKTGMNLDVLKKLIHSEASTNLSKYK